MIKIMRVPFALLLCSSAMAQTYPSPVFNGVTIRLSPGALLGADAAGVVGAVTLSGAVYDSSTRTLTVPSYALPTATSSVLGGVRPDGTTIETSEAQIESKPTTTVATVTPIVQAVVVAETPEQEIARLRVAITRTNLATSVTIELGGKPVTKTLAEWIQRRGDKKKKVWNEKDQKFE